MEYPATNLGGTDNYARFAKLVRAELERGHWSLDQWINAGESQPITRNERVTRAELAWALTEAWEEVRKPAGPPDPEGWARNHVCGLLVEAVADLLSLPPDPDVEPAPLLWGVRELTAEELVAEERARRGRQPQALALMAAWLEAERHHRGFSDVLEHFSERWTRPTADPVGAS
jgi:hypothetical protein